MERGIKAENDPKKSGNKLDQAIISASSNDPLREQVFALTSAVENVSQAVKNLDVNHINYFEISAARLEGIDRRLQSGMEELSRHLATGLSNIDMRLSGSEKKEQEVLRNVIALRSVFYIYLISQQLQKIEPEQTERWEWKTMIDVAQKYVNKLSVEEVKSLSADLEESEAIRRLGAKIFD